MIEIILNNVMKIVISILTLGITLIYKKICAYKKKLDTTQNGLKAILKIKILEFYDKLMKNDIITVYEKEIFIDLYNEYKLLGGNGIIEDIINDINNLELVTNK